MPLSYQVLSSHVLELRFTSSQLYADPFNTIELDLVVTSPSGQTTSIPGFWRGGQDWAVRFSAQAPGGYSFTTACSNPADSGLHGLSGNIRVAPYTGTHPLYAHGGLRVRPDRKTLEHSDGTPFFWLGDTWWMAFTPRLHYPEGLQTLCADRTAKGFTVVHMVAGLFPDMNFDDERGANEGGFAWWPQFERINPAFFDQADLKLQYIISQGLTPLIVGAWGYYLPLLGMEKMKKHWRYLVARWAAYPVLWCLAGEVTMPYYLSPTKSADEQSQKEDWSEVGRYLSSIDPYDRPMTAHNGASGESYGELSDPACLDFNFVQAGHGNINVAYSGTRHVRKILATSPLLPLVNGETCYEGILGSAHQDVQRFLFWSMLLSGAYGFSYGANGIWQFNETGKPYGPSPHGMTWGNIPWEEAMKLPGAQQISLGKRLLERYRWWLFEAHPEWLTPHADETDTNQPYAAGIPSEVRLFYFPTCLGPWLPQMPTVHNLEAGVTYRAFYFDPITGAEQSVGDAVADAAGNWTVPMPTAGQDNVLVLEAI